MTIARMLCLIFTCAALLASIANAEQSGSQNASAPSQGSSEAVGGHLHDNAHAAKSGQTKAQTSKQTSTKAQPTHNETALSHAHSNAGINGRNSAGQVTNDRGPASFASSVNSGQTSQSGGVATAKGATIPNPTVRNGLPARPPTVTSPAVAAASNRPRHRDPNPAVISGLTIFKARNSAVLSGTGMHRKP